MMMIMNNENISNDDDDLPDDDDGDDDNDDDDDDDEDDLPNLLSHGVILVPHVKLENVSLMANLVGNDYIHIILKTNMMISHIF